MIQGGDVLYGNGYGATSVYGKVFVDEHFGVRHDRPGMLSMANSGPNTNGCQFFITTAPAPHLDGKHVAFGQVVVGYDIVKEIESFGSADGRPRAHVEITDSGELNEAGFLAEVAYERTRLRAKIDAEKDRDIEELRIYNECLRSGIEYVPRPVRERYLHDVVLAEKKQKEVEDFSLSSVRQALSSNVEMLTQKAQEIEQEALADLKSRGAHVDDSKLKRKTPPKESPSFFGLKTTPLTKDVLGAIRASRYGQQTLLESLEESNRTGGKNASSAKSRLSRFTDRLMAKATSGIEPFWVKIDLLLQHSTRTPAPLTPEIVMDHIEDLRAFARQTLEIEAQSKSDEERKKDMDLIEAEIQSDAKIDKSHASILAHLERNPYAHSLSPQMSMSQSEAATALVNELEYLIQFLPSSPADMPLAPVDMPDQIQVSALLNKKRALEQMLKPFADNGMAMPFDALSSTFEDPAPKAPRKKKIVKY